MVYRSSVRKLSARARTQIRKAIVYRTEIFDEITGTY